jgi:hypothetical protein
MHIKVLGRGGVFEFIKVFSAVSFSSVELFAIPGGVAL